MAKILLVEDDPISQRFVHAALNRHEVLVASTLAEARRLLNEQPDIDLGVIDLMLPDGDGLGLCSEIQSSNSNSQMPLIVLTGKSGTEDKVAGLAAGVDDYIVKPFEPLEFQARVELRLRKSAERMNQGRVVKLGHFRFQLDLQKVTYADGRTTTTLDLTPFEFKLLHHLAKHQGETLSREHLLTSVWGDHVHVSDRTIDSHMSHLRKRLIGTPHSIKSVYGEGYRFV